MDDDGTGWDEVLVGGWSAVVRDAVVARIEVLTRGWRGPLVRVLADDQVGDDRWTELLHAAVVRAIADETGADLDELGSQAAWACYEQVWDELTERWADGGPLAVVPLGREPVVTELLAQLPAEVAATAGADVRGATADPLWIRGRLRVDDDGLRRVLEAGHLASADELRVEAVLAHLTRR